MKRSFLTVSMLVGLLILSGCNNTPAPNPDGPRLVGVDVLPKNLATVELSPTPGGTEVQATLERSRPTAAPIRELPTATITPYPGSFMGNITPDSGTVVYRATSYRPPPAVVLFGATAIVPGIPVVISAGTPVAVLPTVNPAVPCATAPASEFANAAANATIRARLGCPSGGAGKIQVVGQIFQNGYMFWRDTREIYVLGMNAIRTQNAPSDVFWRFPDTWTESLPASDPAIVAPSGFSQPVRGFGYVWRSNPQVRETLGWAMSNEQPIESVFQPFERGWMMTGYDGKVIAISPNDGQPTTSGIHFGP